MAIDHSNPLAASSPAVVPGSLRRDLLRVAAFGACLFLPFLGLRTLWTSGEARVAQVARQMRFSKQAEGWIIPRLGDDIRLKKPPLAYWLTAIASLPFADVNELNCRLPSALSAILAMCLIYLLGRDLAGRRAGLLAAVCLGTTSVFWWQARTGNLEMPLLAFNLAAIYAWWRYRRARAAGAGCGWLLAAYAALGFSWLQKGPVGPLLVLLICLAHLALERLLAGDRSGYRLRLRHHLAGILLMLGVALPWPLLVLHHLPHALEIWTRESAGRFRGFDHLKSPFYFALKILGDGQPWVLPALLLPLLLGRLQDTRLRARLLLPLAWASVTLVFFSIPHSKKSYYILFIYPALALMAGVFAAIAQEAVAGAGPAACARARRLWRAFLVAGATLAVLGGCLVAAGLLLQVLGVYDIFACISRHSQISAVYASHLPHLAGAAAAALAGGLGLLLLARRGEDARCFWLVVAMCVAGMAIHTGMLPDLNYHKADKLLCGLLKPRLRDGDRTCISGMSGVPIMTFYLSGPGRVQHVRRLYDPAQVTEQVETPNPNRLFIMTKEDDWQRLHTLFVLRAVSAPADHRPSAEDAERRALARAEQLLAACGRVRILGRGRSPRPPATGLGRHWLLVAAGRWVVENGRRRFVRERSPETARAFLYDLLAGKALAFYPLASRWRRLDFPPMPNRAMWLQGRAPGRAGAGKR